MLPYPIEDLIGTVKRVCESAAIKRRDTRPTIGFVGLTSIA